MKYIYRDSELTICKLKLVLLIGYIINDYQFRGEGVILSEQFNRLFTSTVAKDAAVVDVYKMHGAGGGSYFIGRSRLLRNARG